MKRLIAAIAILLCAAIDAHAGKAYPPSPTSYIHNEGVIADGAAALIGGRLASVESRTGHQFVVALFQTLDGENIEDYTNRLFKHWKIGSAQRSDGLLMTLFLKERQWRIEVGYGLEGVITDLEAAEFGRDGVAYYKKGDYAGGVSAVVDRLAGRLEGTTPPRPVASGEKFLNAGQIQLIVITLVVLVILIANTETGPTTLRGRRRRHSGDWTSGGGGWSSGAGGGWSSGGGGFSGGGGSSGGGGASGGW